MYNPYKETGRKAVRVDANTVVLAKADADPNEVIERYKKPRPLTACFSYIEQLGFSSTLKPIK